MPGFVDDVDQEALTDPRAFEAYVARVLAERTEAGVRPGARRWGHATAMLAAASPIARSLGISRALVMCDRTNTASRRVIESSGGELLDVTALKRRYWVPTAPV
ncbi:GNAT family N-acetyltransferase [Nonomuraea mesophila]|uniref:GNAT family N-acetyltransferase n=1 Tax=Nonomuraea mesophila TaxID=2530382 RepID=UPI001C709E92|nr:hypothetical protein [Nonomuraea mesophila]